MVRRALLPLLLVVGALAGCGSGGASGSAAEHIIKDDWKGAAEPASKATWPGHPELNDTHARAVSCPARPDASRRMRCRVTLESGGRVVPVIATFDAGGRLVRWDLGR